MRKNREKIHRSLREGKRITRLENRARFDLATLGSHRRQRAQGQAYRLLDSLGRTDTTFFPKRYLHGMKR